MKVDAEAHASTVKEIDIVASVSILCNDGGEPFTEEKIDKLVEALSDKVVSFVDACIEEGYFVCGCTKHVEVRTPEFHPDDRSTDGKSFPAMLAMLESEEEIEAREMDKKAFPATLESEEEIEAREQREQEEREWEQEQEREWEQEQERKTQKCVACHATTTQLAANQCPMCGNPFT